MNKIKQYITRMWWEMFDKLKRGKWSRVPIERQFICSLVLKKKKRNAGRWADCRLRLARCSVFDYRLEVTISAPTSIFYVRFPARRASSIKAKRREGMRYAGGCDFQPSRHFITFVHVHLLTVFLLTVSLSCFPSEIRHFTREVHNNRNNNYIT